MYNSLRGVSKQLVRFDLENEFHFQNIFQLIKNFLFLRREREYTIFQSSDCAGVGWSCGRGASRGQTLDDEAEPVETGRSRSGSLPSTRSFITCW
jgi:hypothetical protein